MSKKLKCWKKEKLGKTDKLYRNPSQHISFNPRGIAEYPHHVLISKKGIITDKMSFKKKDKALSFAQKYMEEHDSC